MKRASINLCSQLLIAPIASLLLPCPSVAQDTVADFARTIACSPLSTEYNACINFGSSKLAIPYITDSYRAVFEQPMTMTTLSSTCPDPIRTMAKFGYETAWTWEKYTGEIDRWVAVCGAVDPQFGFQCIVGPNGGPMVIPIGEVDSSLQDDKENAEWAKVCGVVDPAPGYSCVIGADGRPKVVPTYAEGEKLPTFMNISVLQDGESIARDDGLWQALCGAVDPGPDRACIINEFGQRQIVESFAPVYVTSALPPGSLQSSASKSSDTELSDLICKATNVCTVDGQAALVSSLTAEQENQALPEQRSKIDVNDGSWRRLPDDDARSIAATEYAEKVRDSMKDFRDQLQSELIAAARNPENEVPIPELDVSPASDFTSGIDTYQSESGATHTVIEFEDGITIEATIPPLPAEGD